MSFSTSLSGGCTRDRRYIVKTYWVDTVSEASDAPRPFQTILTRCLAWLPPFLVALVLVPSAAPAPPRVLFTGDSTIAPIAAQATRRLEQRREARVRGRACRQRHLEAVAADRLDYAPFQIRRDRPRATVVLIGANDGYPLLDDRGREVACCRRAWVDAYARDAGEMMGRTRRGAARLLADAAGPRRRHALRIYAAVNVALRRAARRDERVRLLDMVEMFTPGYRYRRKMVVDGKRVAVRERDGVHLNFTGDGSRCAQFAGRCARTA